jgi:pimeloyl-ACP methyl ester carboxylesterase
VTTTAPDLHLVELGAGTPVLALHGWTPDHRIVLGCLEPVLAALPGYRRLYPDLPAMGRTPAGDAASSADLLAVVESVVEERIGDEPFLVVGESYGGYLARALARSRPDQVLGVALICPLGTLDHAARPLPPRQVLHRDPAVAAALAALDPAVADGFDGIAVCETPETLTRYLAEVQTGLDLADHAAMARIAERWALTADPDDPALPPFERPSLVVTGRQDDRVGYVDQLSMLDSFPRATVAVLDLAGHNAQVERPDLFSALVRDWLERVELDRARREEA